MNLRSTTAAATMVIGAMTIGFGVAHAEPAPAAAQPISYSVKLVDKTVVATLKGGTFELTKSDEELKDPDLYTVKDELGNTVLSVPLDVNVDQTPVDVKPVVKDDGKVLELT